MGRHLSQSTVSNPMDANRKYISQMIEMMGELTIAIDVAPGNFAVADLNRLKVAADAFAAEIEKLGQIHQVAQNKVTVKTPFHHLTA